MKSFLGFLFLVAAHLSSSAQSFLFDVGGRPIPDGDPLGVSDTRAIDAGGAFIGSLSVMLNIRGGFNGDIYAQLTHASGFSVLLNQVGARLTDPLGYSDSGFAVTLSDNAVSGDIHNYRFTLFGSEDVPLDGPLLGTWAPDGRPLGSELNPSGTARTRLLSSFVGLPADGAWTLFVADGDSGGEATLRSWGLNIVTVPEPGTWSLMGLGASVLCLVRRCSTKSKCAPLLRE